MKTLAACALLVFLLGLVCADDTQPIDKPGRCPPYKKCLRPIEEPECSSDYDCLGIQKCCYKCGLKCRDPEYVKPGQCTTAKPKCETPIPDPECQDDSECPGDQKCCDFCGRQCLKPGSVKN